MNHVKRKHLRLLIYQHPVTAVIDDMNGNSEELLQFDPWGLVLLPLHQFYIAFSNDDMANRMIKEKVCMWVYKYVYYGPLFPELIFVLQTLSLVSGFVNNFSYISIEIKKNTI